jgi:hypothetical protein
VRVEAFKMGAKRLKKGVKVKKSQDPIDELNAIFRRRGVTTKERNMIWYIMSDMCLIQLAHKDGPYYEVMTKRVKELAKLRSS